jgi:hypothetical protein
MHEPSLSTLHLAPLCSALGWVSGPHVNDLGTNANGPSTHGRVSPTQRAFSIDNGPPTLRAVTLPRRCVGASVTVLVQRGRGVGEVQTRSAGFVAECILKGCHMPPERHLLCQTVQYIQACQNMMFHLIPSHFETSRHFDFNRNNMLAAIRSAGSKAITMHALV